MRYSEYTGRDASSLLSAWPSGPGVMSERGYAVPVYRGWPDKPYMLLGSVRHENPRARWDEGDVSAAASEAKQHGGQAIIIRQGAEFGVSRIAGAVGDPLVLSGDQTTALVIRWLTTNEIATQTGQLSELHDMYKAVHPNMGLNRDVTDLAFYHVFFAGSVLGTEEFKTRYTQTMDRVSQGQQASLAGEWLFKATLSTANFVANGDAKNSFGVASVSVDGESLTIVSKEGRTEFTFSGTLAKGRLSGQVGLGSFTSKCEGAATQEKISFSFQSMTPDGAIRGNVVLQRLIPKPPK